MTEQRHSYAGECVDVGVDVHKETYTVTCVSHFRHGFEIFPLIC